MSRISHARRRQGGFTITELALVMSVISSVPVGAYLKAQEKATQTECINNLSNIGKMVQLHEMEYEEMPRAAFYPANPLDGENSLRVILREQGDTSRIMTCPAMPNALLEKGLSFVYNDDLAGAREPANPEKKWLLTEFTCVSSEAPKPHPGGWNFLFADGHVATHDVLPSRITALRDEFDKAKKP